MKGIILITAAVLAWAGPACAEQVLQFPRQSPAFSVEFADTWIFDHADRPSLFARSVAPGDEAVSAELLALKASGGDDGLREAAVVLGRDFSRLKVEPPRTDRIKGFKVTFFRATGENDDGGIDTINCAIFRPVANGSIFMLMVVCPPREEQGHADDIKHILSTIHVMPFKSTRP